MKTIIDAAGKPALRYTRLERISTAVLYYGLVLAVIAIMIWLLSLDPPFEVATRAERVTYTLTGMIIAIALYFWASGRVHEVWYHNEFADALAEYERDTTELDFYGY